MIVKLFLVESLTDGLFSGGRTMVVVLRHLGQEAFLQSLAAELGLPVTAYVLPGSGHFMVRYFSPTGEISAADHASLAVAHVLFEAGLAPADQPVALHGRGGLKSVCRKERLPECIMAVSLPQAGFEKISDENSRHLALSMGLAGGLLEVYKVGGGHLLGWCQNLDVLQQASAKPATDVLAGDPSLSELLLCAPIDSDLGSTYTVRRFASEGELLGEPLDFSVYTAVGALRAAKGGRGELEVQHLTPRGCRLWVRLMENRPASVSGAVRTILKGDPVLSELKAESAVNPG